MKIVHIAPSAPYNDYWGYQENILPKYHQKLGNETTLIVTTMAHSNGKMVDVGESDYVLDDGVRVIRKKRKKYHSATVTNIKAKMEIFDLLKELCPDYVFFHGLVSSTIIDVVKYKKIVNRNCVIVQDNHLDYNIGFKYKGIKKFIIKTYYRFLVAKTKKYIDKYYGVTPWRKTYAEDFFHTPKNNTDVLIMGADDEKIDFAGREKIRQEIRQKYGILNDDFLITTGGKIDANKNIHLLMRACKNIKGIKILIFGQVHADIADEFDKLLKENQNLIYIGWVSADAVYDYFFASDLIFFPGQHSVLWEQACASKVPTVFKKWEGMDHVDNGGNSCFIHPVTVEEIKKVIGELRFTEKYNKMLSVAQSEKTDIYLYSNIAKQSLKITKRG